MHAFPLHTAQLALFADNNDGLYEHESAFAEHGDMTTSLVERGASFLSLAMQTCRVTADKSKTDSGYKTNNDKGEDLDDSSLASSTASELDEQPQKRIFFDHERKGFHSLNLII